MDNLLNWPSEKCEKALKISKQEFTKYFCKINKKELAEFKKQLDLVILEIHPEWRGKKICYKSDEHTSQNVVLGSFESIVERCSNKPDA